PVHIIVHIEGRERRGRPSASDCRCAAHPMTINRRALLGLGTAAAVTALTTFSRGAPALAQSGGYKLIRHGHVLTLDPTLGEIPDGDVLILDDERSEEHTSELQSRENLVC